MNKPEESLEKQFNQNGIFFLPETTLLDDKFEGKYISVDVGFAVKLDAEITTPDFSVSVVNKREVSLLFTDWQVKENEGQKVLTFKVSERLPENIEISNNRSNEYMSFLDLCFYAGNEKIPEIYGEDIITKPYLNSVPKDLGWTLPSRFVDALIDALGKIDDTMLVGHMQHALIYGPNYITKELTNG